MDAFAWAASARRAIASERADNGSSAVYGYSGGVASGEYRKIGASNTNGPQTGVLKTAIAGFFAAFAGNVPGYAFGYFKFYPVAGWF